MRLGVWTAILFAIGEVAGWQAHAAPPPIVKRSPALVPAGDGYLYCVVRADGVSRMDVVTRLLAASGADVTEFGTSFVASPEAMGDGRYHVEHDFGSMHDDARRCEVSVRGAKKNDLRMTVTLESRDASGSVLESAQAR
jgi:hypothetical protein